ncbi:helix-turn-helix domain-containing protein [Anaerotruncus rubiinfantis]|uniref:helix-turn-helix domain-containing protein n=1 Tax=Anaerotruncus rubiinfantis TaxID=1720200 RepID=UPI003D7B93D9
MNFIEKLDYLMESRSLNRHSLSQACGIPYTTIDGWYKKGYEGAKLSTIRKLAEYFNTTLDYLILDSVTDPQHPKDPEPERFEVDERERALVLAYRNNPAMQPAVDRLLGLDFSDMPIPDFQRIKTDAENFTREIMKNQNMPAKK